MSEKMNGNQYRSTLVCVDSYDHKILKGRFYNPYYNKGKSFESLAEFLLFMEEMVEEMRFPVSFDRKRSFSQEIAGAPFSHMTEEEGRGKKGTFEIKILFRQNASWQGLIVWQDHSKEESFRSVLEMITLMDSALQ